MTRPLTFSLPRTLLLPVLLMMKLLCGWAAVPPHSGPGGPRASALSVGSRVLDPSHISARRAVFTVFAAEGGVYPATLLSRIPSALRLEQEGEGDSTTAGPRLARARVNGRLVSPSIGHQVHHATAGDPYQYALPLRRGLNTVDFPTQLATSLRLHVADKRGGGGVTTSLAANPGLFSTLEAEDAECHGVIIGPSYDSYAVTPHLAAEASGRRACQLQRPGDYVQFTATADFNALSVRASIPDAPKGGGLAMSILVAVGKGELRQLNLTSAYSWYYGSYPYSNDPSGGKAHHFYDEARILLPHASPSGTKIRLTLPTLQFRPDVATSTSTFAANCSLPFKHRRDCGFFNITAAECRDRGCCFDAEPPAPNPEHIPWCYHGTGAGPSPGPPSPPPNPTPPPVAPPGAFATVDLLDLYDVDGPLQPPAGAVDITSHGADPTGREDSAEAFVTAFSAAAGTADAAVWIPNGTFTVGSILNVPDHLKIHGAGPWHSVVRGTGEKVGQGALGFYAAKTPGSADIGLFDFSIVGHVRERCDSCQVNGIGGAPSHGSTIQNLWIQHTKCGLWLDGPGTDLLVTSVIVRDTAADGINLHTGWSGVTISFNSFRNTGDDSIALWSDKLPDFNNTIHSNVVQIPVLANGIAVYGGHSNTATNNYVRPLLCTQVVVVASVRSVISLRCLAVSQLADTIAQGGGLHVGNRFNSVALSGTTTLARNELHRCGCLDLNWKFGVGAVWFYALDSEMDGKIAVSDTKIFDSPLNALGVIGKKVSGLSFSNISIEGVGTFVLDVQCGGDGYFSDVQADSIGFHPIYSCGAPFVLSDGGGNTGWLNKCQAPKDCIVHNDTRGTCARKFPYCTHCGWPSLM